jgi:hypothetical protein
VPNGVTRVTVELWGAGAGGAGAPPIGHGGGGGAYTRIVMAVSQGASLRIVIGAGGAGGVAMNGADGSSTQLMLQGNLVAEADGGKGDGTGGRKSSASGVVALAGPRWKTTSAYLLSVGWLDIRLLRGPRRRSGNWIGFSSRHNGWKGWLFATGLLRPVPD